MAKRRRFYRANLPSVVWDAKKGKALAEFVKGEFITSDERTASILIEKGYPEVDMDALDPPDFEVQRGKSLDGVDIKVMPPKYGEEAALNKQKAAIALGKATAASQRPTRRSAPKAVIKPKPKPKREVKRRKRKKSIVGE